MYVSYYLRVQYFPGECNSSLELVWRENCSVYPWRALQCSTIVHVG
uniref:Uncharacterized protein n=1 Tax=Anguilla anguilla TaxID=7936 RepID=A0A0E9XCB7_ANGAN